MTKPHGPYFKGQESSAKCGHFFPDIVRIGDYKANEFIYVRLMFCIHCGFSVDEIRQALYRPGCVWKNLVPKVAEVIEDYRKKTIEKLKKSFPGRPRRVPIRPTKEKS
jgi:hypothetical protein